MTVIPPSMPERADVADLAALYLDGALDAARTAQLNALLADDADARRVFVAMTLQSRWLSETFADRMHAGAIARPMRVPPARPPYAAWAIAASLALLGLSAAYLVMLGGRPTGDKRPVYPAAIATVTDVREVVFDSDPVAAGEEIEAQTIRTESGRMELMLTSGTQVNTTGAVELRLNDPMRVTLTRGQASFRCGPEAHGFTVQAPGVAIVDLGTRFAVRVSASGRTVLDVAEGLVEYRFTDGSLGGGRVEAGRTVTLDTKSGTVTELAAADRLIKRDPPRVIVTEIMYDPVGDDRLGTEWVEITNIGYEPVDVSGWTLRDEDHGGTGTSPIAAGTVIAPGRSLVIIPRVGASASEAEAAFGAAWGEGVPVAAVSHFATGSGDKRGLMGLSSTASATNEILTLRDSDGDTVDTVNYEVGGDWPGLAEGSSIYLLAAHYGAKANNAGASWALSRLGVAGVRQSRAEGKFTGSDIGSPGTVANGSADNTSQASDESDRRPAPRPSPHETDDQSPPDRAERSTAAEP